MSLIPNRWVEVPRRQYPDAEQWSEGLSEIFTRIELHQSPNGELILLGQTVRVYNQGGEIIREEVETWDYEGINHPPREYTKLTRGELWLPGRNQRGGLQLVDQIKTVYWTGTIYSSDTGTLSHRTEREGLVIYRLTPVARAFDADATATHEDQGRETDGDETTTDLVLDSAATWEEAVGGGVIVEDTAAPQRAVWKKISIDEVDIKETESLIITTTTHKSHLRPGDSTSDTTVEKKPGVQFAIPVPIDSPDIAAREVSDAIRIDLEGGGAAIEPTWPAGARVPIRPETYKIYRMIVSRPARSSSGDRLGLWDSDPAAADRLAPGVEETASIDLSGTPTSSLPSAAADTEPVDESPDPPDDAEHWSMIAEVENVEPDGFLDGQGTYTDEDVENGAVYRYQATCVCSEHESDPSRTVDITYGGASATSTRGVTATAAFADRGNGPKIEIDVEAPDDVELLDALGDFATDLDEYGEFVAFEVPTDFARVWSEYAGREGLDVDVDATAANTLAAAEDWARGIGEAQFSRDLGQRRVKVVTTFPILTIHKGSLLMVPTITWKTYGNSLVITSETVPTLLWVEGWSYNGTSGKDGCAVSAMTIDCRECVT